MPQPLLAKGASNPMRTSKIKIQGLTIPYLIGSDSERYWPMRPICEAMGLNWHSQAAKMHPPRYSPREHDVSLPGQPLMKRALCLPQSEFEFWLKSLSSRKVSPAVRRHLDQLRTHFFGGAPTVEEQPQVPTTAAAPAVLNRILNWRTQQADPANRQELLKQMANQFRGANGFGIAETQDKTTNYVQQSPLSVRSSISMIARRRRVRCRFHCVSMRSSNPLLRFANSICLMRTSPPCSVASTWSSSIVRPAACSRRHER